MNGLSSSEFYHSGISSQNQICNLKVLEVDRILFHKVHNINFKMLSSNYVNIIRRKMVEKLLLNLITQENFSVHYQVVENSPSLRYKSISIALILGCKDAIHYDNLRDFLLTVFKIIETNVLDPNIGQPATIQLLDLLENLDYSDPFRVVKLGPILLLSFNHIRIFNFNTY